MLKKSTPPRHYFDWAATAIPENYSSLLNNESLAANEASTHTLFGNPSSGHWEGRLAKEALENARTRCGRILRVGPEKLFFTSGGTESNAIILHSLLMNKGKGRLLYAEIEHPSIRENCKILEKLGISTGIIGVEKDGRISVDTLSRALEKYSDVSFTAIMAVNNETGAKMEIGSLASLLRKKQQETGRPIHLHCDMVQALGKIPIEVDVLDSASFSAHKLGGNRGIGLLYLNKKIQTLFRGGEQEGGIRSGTENTLGAIALASLLERRADPGTAVIAENKKARERFKYLIGKLKKINRCLLIPEDRSEDDERFSPWILQLRIKDIPGAVMARALDKEGIAVSTGSACSSASPDRPVLAAMGADESLLLEGFRISQGWSTTIDDIDALLMGIEKVISYI